MMMCPQVFLDGDGFFGGEAVLRAVDVALEGHAILIDLAVIAQGEDLETARVSQHGVRPVHELVQTAHLGYQAVAGAQVQVVGVGEHQAGADFFELLGVTALTVPAHRCESRSGDRPVRGVEYASAGAPLPGLNLEGEGRVGHRG
jgi:hypothetical protein